MNILVFASKLVGFKCVEFLLKEHMNDNYTDLIIVGAGLVGTSIALGLKDQPVSIEILENQPSNTKKQTTQDTRPLSLSYGSHLTLVAARESFLL